MLSDPSLISVPKRFGTSHRRARKRACFAPSGTLLRGALLRGKPSEEIGEALAALRYLTGFGPVESLLFAESGLGGALLGPVDLGLSVA